MNIKERFTELTASSKLSLQKNAPHITFGLGLVATTAGAVLAAKATTKLEEKLDQLESDVSSAKESRVKPELFEGGEATSRDMAMIYMRHTGRIAKLYGPAVITYGTGVGLLVHSHVSMTRRNASLAAAYAGLHQAFQLYREKVREELGEERERELYHNMSREEFEVDGELHEGHIVDPNKLSVYAVMFDEANPYWHKEPEYNRIFLQTKCAYFNHILQARGHVFLNEVLDELGFDHTKAGAVIGWYRDAPGGSHVDFGIFDATSSRFLNNVERSIILDFNVNGNIYNLMENPR